MSADVGVDPPQHEAITQAARELAATCPPLTEAQRERLRVLLDLPGDGDA